MKPLLRLRARIDRVDRQLARLLSRRARLVTEAFARKRAARAPLYDARRMAEILDRIERENRGPLSGREIRGLFSHLLHFFALEFGEGADLPRRSIRVRGRAWPRKVPLILVRQGRAPRGCLRLGRDVVEEAGPARKPILLCRAKGERADSWLARAFAVAGAGHAIILCDGDLRQAQALRRRTDLPVVVDCAGARAARAALRGGVDGVVLRDAALAAEVMG